MSRCEDDERPATPELLAEAIAHATDFLFAACHSEAMRVTRGPDGENGAIFILRNPRDIEAFTRLYLETFLELGPERVDVVARTDRTDPDGSPVDDADPADAIDYEGN